MPESLTRNPDEASRYAASQVRRLKVPDESVTKPKRKIKKNVHEVIRKVTQTEEEEPEENASSSGGEDMVDEASNQTPDGNNLIIANNGESTDSSGEKKYILIRKSGRLRGRRRHDNLKAVDKYKKVIKVYRN